MIFIHYKDGKAKALELIDAKSMKFDPTSLKLLLLTEFKTKLFLETGEFSIICAVIINCFNEIFIKNISNYYPYMDIKNEIVLNECEKFCFFLKISVLFNIFAILLILIKTVWGNIWNSINKKKG